jgi:drug/metabolite transporter (DMT)-like permease
MNEVLLKKISKPLIVIATLVWGSTFFILKDTLDSVDLQFLLAFRFTVAAVVLAAVFWRHWKGMDRSCWWRGMIMGLFLYTAYTVQNLGLMETTPGKNAFFTSVYCVIVPFLYWVVDRLRPDKFNVLAALLCIVGVGFVSWDGGFSIGYGEWMTLLSGLLYACHIVATSKFAKGRDVFLLTVIQFGTTAVCCWVGTLITGGFPASGLPSRAWWVLVYLAIAATPLALLFQNIGQAHLPPASAALLLSLEAVFGVAFSVALGAESLTLRIVIGFALVFAAIVVSEVLPERAKR